MKRLYNIPLIILLLASPAAAEPMAGVNFKGQYTLAFSGIPFGKMGFEAHQDPARYSLTSDVISTGLAEMLAQHRSHTTVSAIGANFSYPDKVYQTHSQTRKKNRDIRMETKAGQIMNEVVVPADNPQKRKPVPPELKNGSYDPLSLILAVRQKVIAQMVAETTGDHNVFTVKLYDGRRLTQGDAIIHGRKIINWKGVDTPVVHVSIKRKLLAGFAQSELDRYDPNEPPLSIYFSDDERFLPIKLAIPFTFGQVSATLTKECAGAESCLLGL